LTKREIYREALALRDAGKLFRRTDPDLEDVFAGSIDRFCDIAHRLRDCHRVLDVGAGHGILLSLLHALGHECVALDFVDQTGRYPEVYRAKPIDFRVCNVEVDSLPFPDDSFDAAVCCQVLEHFTHSHLPLAREVRRVLRPGGIFEADVPNAVSFRNRSRMLRGKHITFDYREHYLHAQPILYKGMSFYPARHNREFTRNELRLLLEEAGFRDVEAAFLKSRRHRTGVRRALGILTALRDAVPSLRKSLIAFARK